MKAVAPQLSQAAAYSLWETWGLRFSQDPAECPSPRTYLSRKVLSFDFFGRHSKDRQGSRKGSTEATTTARTRCPVALGGQRKSRIAVEV